MFLKNMKPVVAIMIAAVTLEQADGASIKNKDDMDHLMAKVGWQAYASVKINNPKLDSAWITRDKFTSSIYDVIGKMIADARVNKDVYNQSGLWLIRFDTRDKYGNLNPGVQDPLNYVSANWNALLICNYIAQGQLNWFGRALAQKSGNWDLHNSTHRGIVSSEWIDFIAYGIKKTYSYVPNIEQKVNKAVKDIKRYITALDLENYLLFSHYWRQQDSINAAPEVRFTDANNKDMRNNTICISEGACTYQNKTQITPIVIEIRNGEIQSYKTELGIFKTLKSDMTLSDRIPQDENEHLKKDLLSKKRNTQLDKFRTRKYTTNERSLLL